MQPIERDIMKTVSWFSLFSFPLTTDEIHKWLFQPARSYTRAEVAQTLGGSSVLGSALRFEDGLWALASLSEDLSELRRVRTHDAIGKMRRVRRLMWWVRFIPTIECVAVGNTLAWMHTRPESDIDLFVVAKPGTLWVTRALLLVPLHLFRLRPGQRLLHAFDFSFFLSSDSLDISSLCLDGGDPYLAYWVMSLRPVLSRGNLFERFIDSNAWVHSFVPNAWPMGTHSRSSVSSFLCTPFRLLDPLIRWVQMRRLPRVIQERVDDSSVVLRENVLKFHTTDRRRFYRDTFYETYDATP